MNRNVLNGRMTQPRSRADRGPVVDPTPFGVVEGIPVGMVMVPAGRFVMGSSSGADAEGPVHEVFVDQFLLDRSPVSNDDFAVFVSESGYRTTAEVQTPSPETDGAHRPPVWTEFAGAGRERHPVVCVSWVDAVEYAKWSGKRLPTEAEWERAARGGLAACKFPWGDDDPTDARCQWSRAADGVVIATADSSTLEPNAFGLHSMVGNVWEWCADWYDEAYYAAKQVANPPGPSHGTYRVRRGGAWNVRETFRLRCANRGAMQPLASWPNLGFRCARSAEVPKIGSR